MNPTLLVGVDYSEQGEHALNAAILLAKDLNALLVLVHAFPRRVGISPSAGDDAHAIIEQYRAELEADEAVALSVEWAKKARMSGLEVTTIARDGPPADAILEEAANINPAMIIVGTHGRKGITKLLMGSVAEDLIKRSRRPVLVVPSPE